MLISKPKIPIKSIILIGFLPGFLKKFIYRCKGYKIGKQVSIGIGSVIIGKDVIIGDQVKIGFATVIRANEIRINRFVQIGSLTMIDTEKVFIDEDARINEKVIVGGIRTPESLLHLGKRTIIMEYSFINPTKPIIIGNDTGIGGHCLLFTHGSWLPEIDGFPVSFAPITLGKQVWLPWRVFIMPGVSIGDRVVIGANSLINKDLPSDVLAAGNPAKIIKTDYPGPVTEEKRHQIIDRIMTEFRDFMNHLGLICTMEEMKSGRRIAIRKGKKTYNILYLMQPPQKNDFAVKEVDLLITDFDQLGKADVKYSMHLDLVTRKRSGTSDAGEEFCKFMSRYGIRFDRND